MEPVFNISIDESKKTFIAFAEGPFTEEKGQAFVDDFRDKANSINSSEYSLIVDVKGVKPSSPAVAEKLAAAIELYSVVPFKNKFFTRLSSAIAQGQCERLGKNFKGFEQIIMVDTKEEALSQI